MKKIIFTYAWILLSAGMILVGIASFNFMSLQQNKPLAIFQNTDPELASPLESEASPAIYGQVQGIETEIKTADARAAIVANFLERHHSPLEPSDHFGQVFVTLADEYGFDFRLLPAIAMQESNLCNKIPAGSYNCLGFGIHERGTLAFESFDANFERAARELKKFYIDIGLTTPELIMTKYTPGSNGSWAESVKQWMSEMKYDDYALGKELKEDNPSVLEYTKTQE